MVGRLVGTHRLIVPDRPGYGASPGPPLGPAGNAAALHRLVVDAGAVPATVVGHSYGAAVAVLLAGRYPGAVSGLVLVCPAVNGAALGPLDRILAQPVFGEALTYAVMRGLANAAHWTGRLLPSRHLADLPVRLGLPADRIGTFTESWRRGDLWRVFALEQRALVAEMPEVEAGLGSVAVPVRILAGRRDRVVPPPVVERLATQLPSAQVTWVPDAGHLLAWRRPDLVAEAITEISRSG